MNIEVIEENKEYDSDDNIGLDSDVSSHISDTLSIDNININSLNNSDYTIDTTIEDFVTSTMHKLSMIHFDCEDLMLLKLFDILSELGAPMYVFDKLTDCGYMNANELRHHKPMSRERFSKIISSNAYGDSFSIQ